MYYCIDCGNEISKKAKRCRSCFNEFRKGYYHSDKTKEKMSKKKIGNKNPFYGKNHTEETKKKMRGKTKTAKQIEKFRQAMLGKKHTKEAKEKMSKAQLKSWETRKINKKFISSWEDKFYRLLIEHYGSDYEFERQFRLRGLNHQFDFALPKFKILIEIDGRYFHDMEINKQKDLKINNFVSNSDWVLFRFDDKVLKETGII